VLSTTPLSRSLEKLSHISRSISPQSRLVHPKTFNGNSSLSRDKFSLKDRAISMRTGGTPREKMMRENPPKLANYVYILEYKREIVSSYLLNTGYVGTYEPNYKLLYNKKDEYTFFYSVFTSKLLETMISKESNLTL